MGRFFTSPGAAGLAAVVAATIAAVAVIFQLRHNKKAEDKRSWWDRFEWATNRAWPLEDKHQKLPRELSIDILTSLVKKSTDETQRSACAGFIKHLLDPSENTLPPTITQNDSQLRQETTTHPKQPEQPISEDDKNNSKIEDTIGTARREQVKKHENRLSEGEEKALRNYMNAARNTSAYSPVVEDTLYGEHVMDLFYSTKNRWFDVRTWFITKDRGLKVTQVLLESSAQELVHLIILPQIPGSRLMQNKIKKWVAEFDTKNSQPALKNIIIPRLFVVRDTPDPTQKVFISEMGKLFVCKEDADEAYLLVEIMHLLEENKEKE